MRQRSLGPMANSAARTRHDVFVVFVSSFSDSPQAQRQACCWFWFCFRFIFIFWGFFPCVFVVGDLQTLWRPSELTVDPLVECPEKPPWGRVAPRAWPGVCPVWEWKRESERESLDVQRTKQNHEIIVHDDVQYIIPCPFNGDVPQRTNPLVVWLFVFLTFCWCFWPWVISAGLNPVGTYSSIIQAHFSTACCCPCAISA